MQSDYLNADVNRAIKQVIHGSNGPITVNGKKDRENDLAKIKCVIETVCVENKNKVLIPIFSNGRCQNILTILLILIRRLW